MAIRVLAEHRQLIGFLKSVSLLEYARSAFFAICLFVIGGSVAALWSNALFVRMTPVSGYEYVMLAVEAILAGFYMGLRAPACSIGAAGSGGILGFLGVACPICNKLLMLLFGGQLLLTYFDPIRPVVGALGIALLSFALWQKFNRRGQSLGETDRIVNGGGQ